MNKKKTLKLITTLVKQYITRIGNVLEKERKQTVSDSVENNEIIKFSKKGEIKYCSNKSRESFKYLWELFEPKTLLKTLLFLLIDL